MKKRVLDEKRGDYGDDRGDNHGDDRSSAKRKDKE